MFKKPLLLLFVFGMTFASCTLRNNKEEKTRNQQQLILYIGTYTDGESEGIYRSVFDTESGTISEPQLATTLTNPSFQCITANKKQLWSVSELNNKQGEVAGFEISTKNGDLIPIQHYFTKGKSPCYVSFHEGSKNVLIANYGNGNVTSIPVKKSGQLNEEISSQQHMGSGPNTSRQEGPHAHSIKPGPDGIYIYSADLGTDKIYVYTIVNNKLELHKEIATPPGAGPRHMVFHPSGKAMAVINELSNTVDLYLPDQNGCFSVFKSSITTLPATFKGKTSCADIHFSPDGQFLYASNRGHNSIACYRVDQQTMQLTSIGWMKENINWPRNFIIDPTGKYMIVANKNTNLLTVYRINSENGTLQLTDNEAIVSQPVCLNLINLNTK